MRTSTALLALLLPPAVSMQARANVPDEISETIVLSTDDLRVTEIEVDEDGYDVLRLRGGSWYHHPDLEGRPDLPVLRLRYLLPPGTTIESVTLTPSSSYRVPGSFQPLPIQAEIAPNVPFVPPDGEIYGSDDAYPAELVGVQTLGSMRGYVLADIIVYPLEFVGATGGLTLYQSLSLEISLQATGGSRDIRVPRGHGERRTLNESRRNWLLSNVRNPEFLDYYEPPAGETARGSVTDSIPYGGAVVSEFPSFDSPPVDYVLVTNEALEARR